MLIKFRLPPMHLMDTSSADHDENYFKEGHPNDVCIILDNEMMNLPANVSKTQRSYWLKMMESNLFTMTGNL